jgi:large subunit ribosomal protein L6
MRYPIIETIEIPEGITCHYEHSFLICKKGGDELKRKISVPEITLKLEDKMITLSCEKGNKNHLKRIRSQIAHINNLFSGLQEKFVYRLESVNVHFPMTIKLEGDKIAINNFLGEKKPRYSKVLPNVKVDIQGGQITVTSSDREAAGQTAANLEKATVVKGRDRRIYQDGIFIVEKPGRKM